MISEILQVAICWSPAVDDHLLRPALTAFWNSFIHVLTVLRTSVFELASLSWRSSLFASGCSSLGVRTG